MFFDHLDEDVVWSVSGRSRVSGTYHGKADFMERAVNPITRNSNELYESTHVWKMQLKDGKITKGVSFLEYLVNHNMDKHLTILTRNRLIDILIHREPILNLATDFPDLATGIASVMWNFAISNFNKIKLCNQYKTKSHL